jgi:hypothetical protein
VLFGGTDLAERIERVETEMIIAATEAARLRAGVAAFVKLSMVVPHGCCSAW